MQYYVLLLFFVYSNGSIGKNQSKSPLHTTKPQDTTAPYKLLKPANQYTVSNPEKVKTYKKQGDGKNVYHARVTSHSIKDSLDKEQQIAQLHFTNETKNKAQDNLALPQQKQISTYISNTYLKIAASFFTILFLVYHGKRLKEKKNREPVVLKKLITPVKNLIETRKQLKANFKNADILNPKELAVCSMDEKFLVRLIELVEHHVSNEKFGVVLLSKQMGMSRSQLHRKLIILLGYGPNRFIRNFRLQRAHRLLKQKTATPSEVSHQVGFGSPSYFTKCFHKHYGYTPSCVQNQDIKN